MLLRPPPTEPIAARITVLIAEDEALLRTLIPGLLCRLAPESIEVVAQCGTRAEVLRHARALQPDVILLDLHMPDIEGGPITLVGADTVAAVLRQCPKAQIVCLTSHDDPAIVRGCLAAGARGYLGKSVTPEEIRDAILTAHAGHMHIGEQLLADSDLVATGSADLLRGQLLEGRRGDVLRLLLVGQSVMQIAETLPIGKKHIEKKIAEIKRLLGVTTQIGIYRACRHLGIVAE